MLIKQETFRLPKRAAQALLLAGMKDAALYAELRKMVTAKSARLVNLLLLRTQSGQRAKVEQIDEYPYATDFDPEQLPQTLTLINPRALGLPAAPSPAPFVGPLRLPQPVPANNGGFGLMGTITPTSFTVRNLGETMEVDPVVDWAHQRIVLNITTESVQLAGLFRENSEEQSQFETQKLNTSVNVASGAPCFLGTLSKNYQTGTVNANQADELSLAFITATIDTPPQGEFVVDPTEAVRYQWEVISVPKATASSLLDEIPDSAALHAKLRTMIKANSAKLEGLQSVRGLFGDRIKSEAVDLLSYPTDFDPPQLIQTLTIANQWLLDIFYQEGGRVAPAPDKPLDPANGGFGIMTRMIPTNFTTRNVGDAIEVDSALADDGRSVHVVMAPERVRLLTIRSQEDCQQPIFETQRLSTSVTLAFNRPLLVGTMSPPVNTGADHGNTEERIWLGFLTAVAPTQPEDPALASRYESNQVLLRDEWFTLPKEDLRLLMVAGLSDGEMRKEIQQRVVKKTATLDRFMLVRTKSGQRAKVEHLDEFPYPTDFDPGQVPQTLTIVDPTALATAMKQPLTPPAAIAEPAPAKRPGSPLNGGIGLQNTVTGTTFTVRNLGDTWEIDPVIFEDGKTIGITHGAERVRFVGDLDYTGIIQPQFQTSKIYASLTAISGQPILAGTCSKADHTGRVEDNTDDNATVSFLTATVTKIPPALNATAPKPAPLSSGLMRYAPRVEEDPFAAPGTSQPVRVAAQPDFPPSPTDGCSMRLQFELISLTQADAAALFDEPLDDPAIHQRLLPMIAANTAQLEKLLSLRTMSGLRAKVEQIAETPYPTDFDPPQIPQTLTIADPQLVDILRQGGAPSQEAKNRPPLGPPTSGFGFITGLSPTTWTIRNVGETVEFDPVLGEDYATVDLTIAPESNRLVSEVKYWEAIQPIFETQKLNTSITTSIGQPCLLGTMSKPVRTGAPGGNQTDRVWLAFITATLD